MRYFHGNYHIERESYTTQTTYKLLRLAVCGVADSIPTALFTREEFRLYKQDAAIWRSSLFIYILHE